MTAPATPFSWRFDAIGTTWTILSEAEISADRRELVLARINAFDLEWSRFRTDSVVARLAENGGVAPVPRDAAEMLSLYRELSAATDGAVNPLVGSSLTSLGYDRDYSLQAGAPKPPEQDWASVLEWNDRHLHLNKPALIDVGALGKGRLVDLTLAELADQPGAVIVDASGDLVVRGGPTVVALEHPYDPTKAIGTATVQDAAVCGSATTRRTWGGGLHHVLDARTGVPVETVVATWAIADTAMRADAIATALFFPGGSALADRWGVSWVRMLSDGRVHHSGDPRVELFTA